MRKKYLSVLQQLQEESKSAVEIIHNTIAKLKTANQRVDEEIKFNEERIKAIQSDNASLSELRTQNEKVVSKFEAFLS